MMNIFHNILNIIDKQEIFNQMNMNKKLCTHNVHGFFSYLIKSGPNFV